MRTSLMNPFHHLRSDVSVMEAYLPSLHRHAEAMTGSRESAGAYMAAMADILAMDGATLPVASGPRVCLFKLYTRLYATLVNLEDPAQTRARQILLLVLMEGFSNGEAAEILDTSVAEIVTTLKSAGCTKPDASRTRTTGTRNGGRPSYRSIRALTLEAVC